jgi:hypothetical protein
MATESFTKEFIIDDPKSIKRFAEVMSDVNPIPAANRSLVCDKVMERDVQLLKRCLSR